jgi:hypothetical protein
LFPSDDQDEYARVLANSARLIVSMADIVQEILTKYANGIHFREWNTGEKLESGMCSEGFILGGNETNSGTWMHKMGQVAPLMAVESPRRRRTEQWWRSSASSSQRCDGSRTLTKKVQTLTLESKSAAVWERAPVG